ncbi:hypothetical protein [Anaerotruncus rubiinfantis]|uniref:hypothetical protein n=1 Tax=Anaerotruncus rubiinfantis TaxID=1720200 RepID=UPI0034A1B019
MKKVPALLIAAVMLAVTATAAYAEELPQDDGIKISVLDQLPLSNEEADPTLHPFDIEFREVSGRCILIRRFELKPGQDAARITASTYEQGNVKYRLLEVLQKEESGVRESKMACQTVTVRTESGDRAAALAQLSPLSEYSEGGYTGQLALDYASIQTVPTDTKSYAYPIRATREFAGLDRADASYIPKFIQNGYGVTLQLADVDWSSLGASYRDDLDLPSSFTAQATYTATGYGTRATGYTTTAQYVGEVYREIPGNVLLSVVYEQVPDHTEAAIRLYFVLALVAVALAVAIVYTVIRHHEKQRQPPAEQAAPQPKRARGKGAQGE